MEQRRGKAETVESAPPLLLRLCLHREEVKEGLKSLTAAGEEKDVEGRARSGSEGEQPASTRALHQLPPAAPPR